VCVCVSVCVCVCLHTRVVVFRICVCLQRMEARGGGAGGAVRKAAKPRSDGFFGPFLNTSAMMTKHGGHTRRGGGPRGLRASLGSGEGAARHVLRA